MNMKTKKSIKTKVRRKSLAPFVKESDRSLKINPLNSKSALNQMQRDSLSRHLETPPTYIDFNQLRSKLLQTSDCLIAKSVGASLSQCKTDAPCKSPFCNKCNEIYQSKLKLQFDEYLINPALEVKALTVNVILLPFSTTPQEFKKHVKKLRSTLYNRFRKPKKAPSFLLYGAFELHPVPFENIHEYDCPKIYTTETSKADPMLLLHYHAVLVFYPEDWRNIERILHRTYPSRDRQNRRICIRDEKQSINILPQGSAIKSNHNNYDRPILGYIGYAIKGHLKSKQFGNSNWKVISKLVCLLESIRGNGIRGWRVSVNKKWINDCNKGLTENILKGSCIYE